MIHLTKDVQSLYTKNYRTLIRHVKEHLKKWDIPQTRTARLNIFKKLILSKLICRFKEISTKKPSRHFSQQIQIFNMISKFIWQFKGPTMAKTTVKNKNKIAILILPDFKTYKSIITKTVQIRHKVRESY